MCQDSICLGLSSAMTMAKIMYIKLDFKMPTVRNARSLVTSRELPSGLQILNEKPAVLSSSLLNMHCSQWVQ